MSLIFLSSVFPSSYFRCFSAHSMESALLKSSHRFKRSVYMNVTANFEFIFVLSESSWNVCKTFPSKCLVILKFIFQGMTSLDLSLDWNRIWIFKLQLFLGAFLSNKCHWSLIILETALPWEKTSFKTIKYFWTFGKCVIAKIHDTCLFCFVSKMCSRAMRHFEQWSIY